MPEPEERRHGDAKTIHLFAYVQPTDPGMVGAKKGWVDTSGSTPILKFRNADNSGWVAVGAAELAGGGGGGSGSGHVIMTQLEAALTQRDTLIFEGTTIQVYDDPVELRTVVRSFSTTPMTFGDPMDPSMVLDGEGGFVMVEYYNG